MSGNLPQEWQDELRKRYEKIKSQKGVDLIDPKKYLLTKSLSVLFLPDETTKKNLLLELNSIPQEILPKLCLQPDAGYHLSVQWTESPENSNNLDPFVDDLSKYIQKINQIYGTLFTTYATDVNLTALLKPSPQIVIIRKNLTTIFNKHGFTPKLPPINTLWISLARYLFQPTPEELLKLQNLPKKEFRTEISKAVICLNDPFFSPNNSTVIKEILLR